MELYPETTPLLKLSGEYQPNKQGSVKNRGFFRTWNDQCFSCFRLFSHRVTNTNTCNILFILLTYSYSLPLSLTFLLSLLFLLLFSSCLPPSFGALSTSLFTFSSPIILFFFTFVPNFFCLLCFLFIPPYPLPLFKSLISLSSLPFFYFPLIFLLHSPPGGSHFR